MRTLGIVLAGLLLVAMATAALADDAKKMDKKEACALIGDCGDEMVQQARKMMDECKSMMAKAADLMDKG